MAAGALPLERLVRTFPLSEINAAAASAERGETVKPVLRPGLVSAIGDILWQPPAVPDRATVVGRFVEWLEKERGLQWNGYHELWRWSVEDLEGFWGALWEFFEIRASTPYERVLGSRAMPGAEWFTVRG